MEYIHWKRKDTEKPAYTRILFKVLDVVETFLLGVLNKTTGSKCNVWLFLLIILAYYFIIANFIRYQTKMICKNLFKNKYIRTLTSK